MPGSAMENSVAMDFSRQFYPYGQAMPGEQASYLVTHMHQMPPDNYPPPPQQYQSMGHLEQPVGSKEAEEVDTSSRPRLTTEQTNILEDNFRREPKPVTEVKKQLAQRIGLSLDKVNNWYQNRRAKAKHLLKQEVLEVLPVQNPPDSYEYNENAAQNTPINSQFVQSQLAMTPAQAGEGNHLNVDGYISPIDATSTFDCSNFDEVYARFDQCYSQGRVAMQSHHYTGDQTMMEASPSNSVVPHEHSATNGDASGIHMVTSAFADWDNNHVTSSDWAPAQQYQSPFDEGPLLLQQEATPTFGQHEPMQQLVTNVNTFPVAGQFTPSATPEHGSTPHQKASVSQTPNTSPYSAINSRHISDDVFARRGSDSSELASNFDTIHLQQGQSQQTSDEEIFKTPAVPNLNLAARRKRQRPAALGSVSLRSRSCAGLPNMSPSTKVPTVGPSLSVRRIKSTGNNLNVVNGRVQKPGQSSAQRSPLHHHTFAEADALIQANNVISRQETNPSVSSASSVTPLTPLSPAIAQDQPVDWSKQPIQVHPSMDWQTNNQTSMTNQYDGHPDITSPPTTPYHDMAQHHAYYIPPPQSAPPQLTTFLGMSPPFQHHPLAAQGYYSMAESFPYYSGLQMPQPQHNIMIGFNNAQVNAPPPHPSHFIQSSQPLGGPPSFQAAAPPAQSPPKELEIVQQTFPSPKGAQQAPKEPHKPKNYIFQNVVPSDF